MSNEEIRDAEMTSKIVLKRDEESGGYLLPKGLTIEQVKNWAIRVADRVERIEVARRKKLERFEGRTFQEKWAKPVGNYYNISNNTMNREHGSWNTGLKILELLETEGRKDIDEVCKEFGALEPELLTVTVNDLRRDHYLKDYKEKDGTQTLELLDEEERRKELTIEKMHHELPKEEEIQKKVKRMGALMYLSSSAD